MSVSFRFHRGQIIRVPIRIRGAYSSRPIMAFDTGSSLTMITPRIAAEIGMDLAAARPKKPVIGVAGSAWVAEVTLPRISLMGMAIENVKALCHPLPPQLGLDGILGLDFLQNFNFTIDHDTETMTVEKRRFPETDQPPTSAKGC